jgi:hypothetical protein
MQALRGPFTGAFLALLLYPALSLTERAGKQQHVRVFGDCIVITTAPYKITEPGRYCLKEDILIATEGLAIEASDVSFDLGGFCLVGRRDPKQINYGIYVSSDSSHVTIINGCIRGLFYGLRVDEDSRGRRPSHITVRNINFEQNLFRGAFIAAENVDFRSNTVVGTGGATAYDNAYAIGLEISGDHCAVDANLISETYGHEAGEGVGIALSREGANGCRVTNNVISNRSPSRFGRTFGIWSSNKSLVKQNTVQNFDYAIVQTSSGEGIRDKNVIINEHCRGVFYANDKRSFHDTKISQNAGRSCADAKDAVASLESVNRKIYFYRKAETLVMRGDWQNATAYFLAAEKLGSAEGARVAHKHLELGLISERQFEIAEHRAAELLLARP